MMSSSPLDERGLPIGYPLNDEWEVSPRAAHFALHESESPESDLPLLLDCREPDEWAIASIPGCLRISMGEIAAHLPDLTAHVDRPIFVICHHGRRSLQVAAFLREQGFDDVRSVAGGIDLWSRAVDRSVPRY